MPKLARVLLTGGAPEDNAELRQQIASEGLEVEVCPRQEDLAHSLEHGDKGQIVVCGSEPSLTHAISLASELKRERPYLPVVIHGERVHEVARLRCLEQGLDDFVSREELLDSILFMARLLATRGTDATLEDIKSTRETRQGQMYFQLHGHELSNALQFLCMTSRQGRLSLKFESGQSGTIYLDLDTVVHAEYEELEGLPAVAKMLRGGTMEARFFEGRQAPKKTNSRSISQVLIEASVIADESAAKGREGASTSAGQASPAPS
jgi:DNA-binding response OmpR family regulator